MKKSAAFCGTWLGVTIFSLFLLMGPSGAHGNEKIVKLSSLEWPPYIGAEMENQGYVAEAVRAAFERRGYRVEIEFFPWNRAVAMAHDGKVDGYFPEYYSDEVAKDYILSEKFPGGPVGFFKRKDKDISFAKLEDLKGYCIGVVEGYVNTAEFDAASYLTKDESVDDLMGLKKLLAGRTDLFFCDKFVGNYIGKKNFPDQLAEIEFMSPILEDKPLYICFSRATPDGQQVAEDFNKGLAEITADGTLEALRKKGGY